jgi:S1-C subfamily serine protease
MTGDHDPLQRRTGSLPTGQPPTWGRAQATSTISPGAGDEDRRPRRWSQRAATRTRSAIPFLGGIVAAFIAIVVYGLVNPPARPLTTQDVNEAVASVLASQTPAPPRSELVYAAVRPSLVFIQVDEPSGAPAPKGLGTGVVVNDSAAVLTALHVVDGATSITVTFADGSTSPATIASRKPESDIAVLQPSRPPTNVLPATIGNPNAMQIGSEAFVVGNPFGLYASLSTGVVSGLDRSYQVTEGGPVFKGLIQVDAAVNPGNSGGPLLDRNGRVVGIVTALVNPTKQDVFIGIGLAVPIDVAGGAAGLPPY